MPNSAELLYSLGELCNREYDSKLQNPRGATLRISPCGEIQCGENRVAKGCITVPGVRPTSTGIKIVKKKGYIILLLFDDITDCL